MAAVLLGDLLSSTKRFISLQESSAALSLPPFTHFMPHNR
jgi:hypothetical protein